MRDIVEVAVTKTKSVLKLFRKEKSRLYRRRRRKHTSGTDDCNGPVPDSSRAPVSPGDSEQPRTLIGEGGGRGVEDVLFDLAHPYTGILKADFGIKADGVSFQPCKSVRNQDRYVVEQFVVNGGTWTLTGVFDGTFPFFTT